MKKIVIGSTIASIMASTGINAATIIEKDGFTYKIKGDFQVQLRKDVGNDQKQDIEFDDLELKNSISYKLENGNKVFGQLDFGFKNAAEDKQSGSDLEEAYVGMDFGTVKVSVGKQNYATDEFGIELAYELRGSEDQFDAIATDGDDVIRVDVETDNFYVVVSAEIEAEGEDSQNAKSTDLFLSTNFIGLELALATQTYEKSPAAPSGKVSTTGISVAYQFDFAKLVLGVSTSSPDTGNDVTQTNIAAVFPVADATKVALGVNTSDEDNAEEVQEIYANVTYKLNKKAKLFFEYGDTDESNIDAGYSAGLNIKF